MHVANDTFFEDGQSSVDLSSNWTSQALPLEHAMMLTIQLLFEGTPAGAFSLECSSEPFDLFKQGKVPTTWTKITGSTQSISEAGDHTWNVEDTGFAWIRIQWEVSGGMGTLTKAQMNAKGV